MSEPVKNKQSTTRHPQNTQRNVGFGSVQTASPLRSSTGVGLVTGQEKSSFLPRPPFPINVHANRVTGRASANVSRRPAVESAPSIPQNKITWNQSSDLRQRIPAEKNFDGVLTL